MKRKLLQSRKFLSDSAKEFSEHLAENFFYQEDESSRGNRIKNYGNTLLKLSEYQLAIRAYNRAAEEYKILGDNQAISICHLNKSLSYLEMDEFETSLSEAEKALSIDPKSIKGIYRKGLSLVGLGRKEEAIGYLNSLPEDIRNNQNIALLLEQL